MRNFNPNESVAAVDRLITDARAGSATALNELLEVLSAQLWAEHSRRSKPQDLGPSRGLSDLIQETLVQARANFDRFERNSFADFKQWARTILRRKRQEWIRNYRFRNAAERKEEIGLSIIQRMSSAESASGPEQTAQLRDDGRRAYSAFRQLKTHEQFVINLRVIEGLRYREIEALTGWACDASRKAYARAMENLRSLLEFDAKL
ncbi:MAG TPA: sigma-70 family RNA polymerase sigma factor [Pirellulales bacterium]|jgi:RNA polymerase sigma factor (sigma-70 family)